MKKRPEHALVINNYHELRDDLSRFAEGKYNFLVLIGCTGVGKTETVREIIGENHVMFEGSPSSWQFYCDLYDNRDATVILDDVDPAFYKSSKSNAYLKALTNTREVKTLRWQTAITGEDRRYPHSFDTTSRVIAITNRWDSINEHIRALEGRAATLIFEPTVTEVHLEVGRRGWFHDQEVYELIWEHRRFITRPNMRLYKKIAEQKAAGRPWRKRALEMLRGDRRLQLIAELLDDDRFASNKERLEAFKASGLGSRTLFYELMKEFRSYKAESATEECPKLADLQSQDSSIVRMGGPS